MIYPRNYQELNENDMAQIEGGDALAVFNYLFGDWLRDMVLGDVRNVTLSSLQQMSVQPAVDTGKRILGWGWPAQLAYVYGFYRLTEQIKAYWKQ